MRHLWYLTTQSVLNRKITFVLSVISIAISVALLLGIDRAAKASRSHFMNTLNQTDLIVAAPNGSLDILLNLVFHIGDGLKKIDYSAFKKVEALDEVRWAVPLSISDAYMGFDVMATDEGYFQHYRYASSRSLTFEEGRGLEGFFDVVIGADVQKSLHHKLGDIIHLAHGDAHEGHVHIHANRDFKIVGILKPTGTPNDEMVFIQLKAEEAIHIEWQSGRFVDMHISSEHLQKMGIVPKHLSGIFVGLKDRTQILAMEERIGGLKGERLTAVIPAKALSKLYRLMKGMQELLVWISSMVFVAAIFGMLASMLSTLNDRRREIAILRSLGAPLKTVFYLFAMESLLIVLGGIITGNVLLALLIIVGETFMSQTLVLALLPDIDELGMMAIMILIALIASILPAIRSYRDSLQDGLTVRS